MYYKKSKTFIKLKPRKHKIVFKQHKILNKLTFCNNSNSFFNVCLLLMSLVIVKGSAITIYQNRTSVTANDQTADSSNILSKFQATTNDFITTNPILKRFNDNYNPQLNNESLTVTNHIIGTNIIVGVGEAEGEEGRKDTILKENFVKPEDKMRAKLQQLLQRENDNDDEEKQQLQKDVQQQMQDQLQQQLQQQQQQYQQSQQSQHAILRGENAYLLERIDGGSMHEQPIYGTWSAKARRPQAPLLAATSTTTTTTTAAATAQLQPSSSIQTLLTEVDENLYGNYGRRPQLQHHHYERLPKRSSTMTPVRRELFDQIPRPPRLTSRQPAVSLRRQFSDTSLPNGSYREESRPKPFHHPFDGPLPEEFKKLQPSEKGSNSLSQSDSQTQVQNIQDILQKLNLGPVVSKMPPLMMMPTGVHISGSFKNLKSSGLGNLFRGKRNKKQIQMQFPMAIPMQMVPNPYQTPIINLMQQPYQQRIAMDQIYPFKPRSPAEINLLAMQQQQQKYKNSQTKSKKQKKKQKDKKASLASSNLMLQQYPFGTAVPEVIFPSMYSPFMAINVTQSPHLQMSKRVPFKVNFDIFPVVPPSKNFKSPAAYTMDETRIVSTMRPPTVLRNPFIDYLTTPVTPANFYNPFNQKQPLYTPMRFPSGPHNPITNGAQSNNMQLVYPEQMQKYLQHQQQQQLQQQQQQQQQQHNSFANYLSSQGHQTPFLPIDCDQPLPSASSSQYSNSKTSPIMVHLNVFPKQKPPPPLSTNPFYSSGAQVQRNNIQDESVASPNSIEPRHHGRSLNDTTATKIDRSDSNENIQQIQPLGQENDLVDFDHPIVAESPADNTELPHAAALVSNNPNGPSESSSSSFYYESPPNTTTMLAIDRSNTNYNGNMNGNMEQMVSEARTASLFRFPVEDLIQFQVHDAM